MIPVGAVIIVLSAAFCYGIMFQKVVALSGEVNALRSDMQELREDVKQLSADVNRLIGSKALSYER